MAGIAVGTALAFWLPADLLSVVFGCFFFYMGARLARQAMSMGRTGAR